MKSDSVCYTLYYAAEHIRCIKQLVTRLGNSIRGLLEKYLTVFFYANTLWIII
jgi:hypothetical protein